MKKKVKLVVLITLMVIAAVFNATKALNKNRSLDVNIANVTAIGNDGVEWNCTTLTTDVYTQYGDCMVCGRTHKTSEWHTRECNSGLFSWCYPGYITIYYDCNGNEDERRDMTEMSGCN